jgi:hypothetical protein
MWTPSYVISADAAHSVKITQKKEIARVGVIGGRSNAQERFSTAARRPQNELCELQTVFRNSHFPRSHNCDHQREWDVRAFSLCVQNNHLFYNASLAADRSLSEKPLFPQRSQFCANVSCCTNCVAQRKFALRREEKAAPFWAASSTFIQCKPPG